MAKEKKSIEERMKSLDGVLSGIRKEFGKESVMVLGDETPESLVRTSTGSLLLDEAIGGGYPDGRIIEIIGNESSGKTTLALHAIAECQKIGGVCAFIDAEHALDPEYAEALGVDISSIIISQPDSGEQALDIAEALIKSGDISFLVVDSVSALVPQAELDGTMGQSHMGLQARLMSQAMRKITGAVQKSGTVVIFINQYRSKIGFVMGDPRVGSGGSALKYFSSIRLEIARIETTKEGGEATANRVRIKVLKNKTYPPYKIIETAIIFGEGLDNLSEVIDMAVKFDIVNKAGSWYSYNDEKIGQGKTKVKDLLEENETLKEEIIVKVKAKIEENKVKVKSNKRIPKETKIEQEEVSEEIEEEINLEEEEENNFNE